MTKITKNKFKISWRTTTIIILIATLSQCQLSYSKPVDPPVEACRPKGDVSIGIDSSYSINNPNTGRKQPQNFNNVRKFVAGIIDSLDEENFRTGVFAWSNRTDLVYPLSSNLTKKQKLAKILKMPYQASNTLTDVAIRFGINQLNDKKLSPRPGVPKLLIIMTDGDPFPPKNRDISAAIKEIKKNKIMPIAIGIGLEFRIEGLIKITLGRKEDVITAQSFDALPIVLDKLRNMTCFIPQKPETGQVIAEATQTTTRLYYCYESRMLTGVYINLNTLNGGVTAFYSFSTRTPSKDDNDGDVILDKGKVWYNETKSPLGRNSKDEQICVLVVTDDKPSNFKIDFTPGPNISIAEVAATKTSSEESTEEYHGPPKPKITLSDSTLFDTGSGGFGSVGLTGSGSGGPMSTAMNTTPLPINLNNSKTEGPNVSQVPSEVAAVIETSETFAKVDETCRPKGDVSIGIDSSFSINNPNTGKKFPENFNNVRKFVAAIVESLDENNFRTGVFAWSNKTNLVYSLSSNLTKKQKIDKILKMPYQALNTLTDVAIRFGINQLKDKKLTPRPGVPKLLIIMTDGDPFPPKDRNISAAIKEIKRNKIMPIAIGIGLEFRVEGLLKIVFGRKEDVITAPNFDALPLVLAKLRNITCVIPQKPQTGQIIAEATNKTQRLYYCYETKYLTGVYVNLDTTKGGVTAFYSFKTRTPSQDDNDGPVIIDKGKVWYNETKNPLGRNSKDEQICVVVVTDNEPITFKIDFTPGPNITKEEMTEHDEEDSSESVEQDEEFTTDDVAETDDSSLTDTFESSNSSSILDMDMASSSNSQTEVLNAITSNSQSFESKSESQSSSQSQAAFQQTSAANTIQFAGLNTGAAGYTSTGTSGHGVETQKVDSEISNLVQAYSQNYSSAAAESTASMSSSTNSQSNSEAQIQSAVQEASANTIQSAGLSSNSQTYASKSEAQRQSQSAVQEASANTIQSAGSNSNAQKLESKSEAQSLSQSQAAFQQTSAANTIQSAGSNSNAQKLESKSEAQSSSQSQAAFQQTSANTIQSAGSNTGAAGYSSTGTSGHGVEKQKVDSEISNLVQAYSQNYSSAVAAESTASSSSSTNSQSIGSNSAAGYGSQAAVLSSSVSGRNNTASTYFSTSTFEKSSSSASQSYSQQSSSSATDLAASGSSIRQSDNSISQNSETASSNQATYESSNTNQETAATNDSLDTSTPIITHETDAEITNLVNAYSQQQSSQSSSSFSQASNSNTAEYHASGSDTTNNENLSSNQASYNSVAEAASNSNITQSRANTAGIQASLISDGAAAFETPSTGGTGQTSVGLNATSELVRHGTFIQDVDDTNNSNLNSSNSTTHLKNYQALLSAQLNAQAANKTSENSQVSTTSQGHLENDNINQANILASNLSQEAVKTELSSEAKLESESASQKINSEIASQSHSNSEQSATMQENSSISSDIHSNNEISNYNAATASSNQANYESLNTNQATAETHSANILTGNDTHTNSEVSNENQANMHLYNPSQLNQTSLIDNQNQSETSTANNTYANNELLSSNSDKTALSSQVISESESNTNQEISETVSQSQTNSEMSSISQANNDLSNSTQLNQASLIDNQTESETSTANEERTETANNIYETTKPSSTIADNTALFSQLISESESNRNQEISETASQNQTNSEMSSVSQTNNDQLNQASLIDNRTQSETANEEKNGTITDNTAMSSQVLSESSSTNQEISETVSQSQINSEISNESQIISDISSSTQKPASIESETNANYSNSEATISNQSRYNTMNLTNTDLNVNSPSTENVPGTYISGAAGVETSNSIGSGYETITVTPIAPIYSTGSAGVAETGLTGSGGQLLNPITEHHSQNIESSIDQTASETSSNQQSKYQENSELVNTVASNNNSFISGAEAIKSGSQISELENHSQTASETTSINQQSEYQALNTTQENSELDHTVASNNNSFISGAEAIKSGSQVSESENHSQNIESSIAENASETTSSNQQSEYQHQETTPENSELVNAVASNNNSYISGAEAINSESGSLVSESENHSQTASETTRINQQSEYQALNTTQENSESVGTIASNNNSISGAEAIMSGSQISESENHSQNIKSSIAETTTSSNQQSEYQHQAFNTTQENAEIATAVHRDAIISENQDSISSKDINTVVALANQTESDSSSVEQDEETDHASGSANFDTPASSGSGGTDVQKLVEDTKPPDDCRPKADISIGIDSSFSINNPNTGKKFPENFNNVRKFVAAIVESLDEENFRTGVFAWSNSTNLVYSLSSNITKKEKIARILKMPYQALNTLTDVAIRYGINQLKDKKLTLRPGVPKILIIMTDGDPFPPKNRDITGAIKDIKKNKIMPIAIGIGLEFRIEGLIKIALDRKENVITSKSFDALAMVLAKLRNLTCVIAQKPETGQVIAEATVKTTRLYYCYETKYLTGVYVNLDTTKGGVTAFYSFSTRTPSQEDNDGKVIIDKGKVWYNETKSNLGRNTPDELMCVFVMTDNGLSTFKIDFTPGPNITIEEVKAIENSEETSESGSSSSSEEDTESLTPMGDANFETAGSSGSGGVASNNNVSMIESDMAVSNKVESEVSSSITETETTSWTKTDYETWLLSRNETFDDMDLNSTDPLKLIAKHLTVVKEAAGLMSDNILSIRKMLPDDYLGVNTNNNTNDTESTAGVSSILNSTSSSSNYSEMKTKESKEQSFLKNSTILSSGSNNDLRIRANGTSNQVPILNSNNKNNNKNNTSSNNVYQKTGVIG